jgi:hypothetical protein
MVKKKLKLKFEGLKHTPLIATKPKTKMPIEFNLTQYNEIRNSRDKYVEVIVKNLIKRFNEDKCECGECDGNVVAITYSFTSPEKQIDRVNMIKYTAEAMFFSSGLHTHITTKPIKTKNVITGHTFVETKNVITGHTFVVYIQRATD